MGVTYYFVLQECSVQVPLDGDLANGKGTYIKLLIKAKLLLLFWQSFGNKLLRQKGLSSEQVKKLSMKAYLPAT